MRLLATLLNLGVAACAVNSGAPTAPSPVASVSSGAAICASENWVVREYPSLTVRYPEALENDAQRLRGFAEAALQSLDDEFAAQGGRELIAGIDIRLSVYANATALANPGRITLDMREGSGRTLAEIHVLAPSCHDVKGMTLVGAPYDDHYFHRVLAHELGTLFLLGITESKTSGWSLSEGPEWFSEGFEEYLGVNHSSAYSRDVTQELYLRPALENPNRVAIELRTENAYLDGTNILRFLHERYGAAKLRAVLTSERSTFWEAMETETGLGPATLVEAFHAWLAARGASAGGGSAAEP